MSSFRKPSAEAIHQFLVKQKGLNFTYSAIGATATNPPAGYVVDHTRINLGDGEKVFEEAKSAIRHWQHFQLGWVDVSPTNTTIQKGEVIAVMGHVLGLWWLNACRIVYVVDEVGPVTRFGFAYGTLPGHAESGEERFQIEWDRSTNEVCYDILAFSRPNYFVTKLGYPLVRCFQKQFARDSAAAMVRAVQTFASEDSK
jgi:uncharacterized protein (UPF0548 family)